MYNKSGVCERKKKGFVTKWRRKEIIFLEFVEEKWGTDTKWWGIMWPRSKQNRKVESASWSGSIQFSRVSLSLGPS